MKGKKLTFEEFSKRVHKLYGDKYDISKVDLEHRDEKGKVCIIYHQTKEEGGKDLEFWKKPIGFLRGKCCFPKTSNKKSDLDTIINKCKEAYGDLYDLSKIKTEGYDKKYFITIGCKKHGWQRVNMYNFANGCGCPACKKEVHHYKYTTESFRELCRKVHGDKYDLSTIVFNGIENPVTVRCPKHGLFSINAYGFSKGHGCYHCGNDKLAALHQKSQAQYIEDCKKVHGDKYIIDETIGYTSIKGTVTPTCPIHGKFTTNASAFLNGYGCKWCGIEARRAKMKMTAEEFIERSKACHKEEYLYDRIDLDNFNYSARQWIGCKKHGYFLQRTGVHLKGSGCPHCASGKSEGEDTIYETLVNACGKENVIKHNRIILKGKEIDAYLPDYKFGVEFDGIRYHSEKCKPDTDYHLNKTLLAKKQGIKLIHVFEDEWIYHKELVIDKLLHLLHKTKNPVIGARECTIKETDYKSVKAFLDKFHIQGSSKATVYLSAYYDDEQIGVMAFSKNNTGWKMKKFCTDINYSLPGLASKMFKHFVSNYKPQSVKAFLDLRWNWPEDCVYNKLGFKLERITKPDYSYVMRHKRYSKAKCTKQELSKKYNLPLTMTLREMTDSLKIYRIWDCGRAEFVWYTPKE